MNENQQAMRTVHPRAIMGRAAAAAIGGVRGSNDDDIIDMPITNPTCTSLGVRVDRRINGGRGDHDAQLLWLRIEGC